MGAPMLDRWFPGWAYTGSLRSRKGQAVVEIGLVTPLLLIALYIPFDFGMGLFAAHLTQNAVREAARVGVSAKDPFDQSAADAIRDQAWNNLPRMLQAPHSVT